MSGFTGFEPSNTTPVPDVLFDQFLSQLSGAELKVLLYIIRRTLGFKKQVDAISLTQFEKGITTADGRILDKGVGLSRETISKALQSLEVRGCIESEKRRAKSGDKDTTLYRIRFTSAEKVVGKSDQGSQKNELPTWSDFPTRVVGRNDQGGRKIPQKVVGKSDLQETVIQETVIQGSANSSAVSTSPMPSANADKFPSPDILSVEAMIAYLQAEGYAVTSPAPPAPTEDTSPPQEETLAESQTHLGLATSLPDTAPAFSVKQEETERHGDSYSQQRQVKPQEGNNQGKILPSAVPKPEMPPDTMPWSPEKMVLLTECLRFCRGEQGVCFSTTPIGKSQKSQRDRQLAAAKKIFDEIPTLTQDEYVQAYSDQNNEWWNREKGSLTVEDMAANTPRKVMRAVELLEKVKTRSERIKERPPSEPGLAVVGQTRPSTTDPEPLHHLSERALALADDWDRICGEKQPRSGNMAAFEELAQIGATIEKMRKVRDSLLAEDFWHKRGVSPRDIIKHFHRASTQQTKLTGYKNSTEGHFVIDTQPYEPQSSYVPASRRKQLEKEKRQRQMKASLAQ